jgi:cell division septum initiation protein DivIVA
MKKLRQLLLAALMPAVLSPAAHADVKETAHEAKENVKAAGKKMGEDAREAAHEVASTAKAAGHAIASGARSGYYATRHAVRKAVGKDGGEGKAASEDQTK